MSDYKYAKWIGDTQYKGGPEVIDYETKEVLILKGEVRKIMAKTSDGYYVLHGLDENGLFGFCEPDEIQLMETPDG